MNENEEEKFPYSQGDVFSKKALGFIIFCFLMAIVWILLSVYGSYKFFTRGTDKAYITQLEQIVVRRNNLIKEKELAIINQQKDIYLLHQTQELEHFLMMLLNPEQKKDFMDVEKYCKQFFMEHRK